MIGINSTFNNSFVNLNIKNNNNSSLNSNTSNANVKNLQDTQDTTKTNNKVLGYEVDKDGFFTSDFNEAAGIPKDYKIYAKGAENFVNYITSLNFKSFTNIDIAKSLGNAYKVFSQLIDEPSGNFTTEDLSKIPLGFSYDKKSFQVENIYQTQKEFDSALSANNNLQIYQSPKQLALSFPSWNENSPNDYTKKNSDIFAPSSHIDIGASFYKNDNGTIGKGGVLMAFFAGMSGQNPLIEGETTIAGKLNGYDKNISQSQVENLNKFTYSNNRVFMLKNNANSIDDLFKHLLDYVNLQYQHTDINDYQQSVQEWIKNNTQETQTTQIQNNTNNSKEDNEKPFKPIQAESKNKETYKDDNTRNELVKKLLEGKFSTSKELELLFGMNFSDDAGEFNQFLSQNTSAKIIDIKA
ncbi:TPA: hypothetical protein RZK14_001403 [Campylobacter coli]|nr:hypothetical protein [Campylobacter coli]